MSEKGKRWDPEPDIETMEEWQNDGGCEATEGFPFSASYFVYITRTKLTSNGFSKKKIIAGDHGEAAPARRSRRARRPWRGGPGAGEAVEASPAPRQPRRGGDRRKRL